MTFHHTHHDRGSDVWGWARHETPRVPPDVHERHVAELDAFMETPEFASIARALGLDDPLRLVAWRRMALRSAALAWRRAAEAAGFRFFPTTAARPAPADHAGRAATPDGASPRRPGP